MYERKNAEQREDIDRDKCNEMKRQSDIKNNERQTERKKERNKERKKETKKEIKKK